MTAIAGIASLGAGNTHSLNIMDIVEDSIQYTLNGGIAFGDDIIYVIETDNGSWTRRDTVYKSFGAGTSVFSDDCSNTGNWTGNWFTNSQEYVSPSSSITDSPFINYFNNTNSDCELDQTFNFNNATYAYATFWAMWEIEDNWDYVQFMASTDGGSSWTPLCGKYTNQGGANQDLDEPLYDGFQTSWVLEEVDLSDYVGVSNVQFKFRLISDGGVTEDGYYLMIFSVYTDATVSMDEFTEQDLLIYPNPANNELNISFDELIEMDKIEITNELGQVIMTIQPTSAQLKINAAELQRESISSQHIVLTRKRN